MMRHSVVFSVLATLAIPTMSEGAESTLVEHRLGSMAIQLAAVDRPLKTGDTLLVRLTLRNESRVDTVLLFRLPQILDPDTVCWYVIDGGGGWFAELGRIQPVDLRPLLPEQVLTLILRIPIGAIRSECSGMIPRRQYEWLGSRYVLFFLGYCVKEGPLKDQEIKRVSNHGFATEQVAIEFEKKLHRVIVGPLRLFVP
jgi:hypothetical protein